MTLGNMNLGTGTFYIDGSPITGISDFECDMETVDEYIKDNIVIVPKLKDMEFEFTCTVSKWGLMVMTGYYAWVIDNCPNRRVKHLIMHGRTKKVRHKNFHRAAKLIAEALAKEDNKDVS